MNRRPIRVLAIATAACMAASDAPAQRSAPAGRPGKAPPAAQGLAIHIPSTAGGPIGLAARIIVPDRPRHASGSPIVIQVPGGAQPGTATGKPDAVGLGFIEIFFAFPEGGFGELASGGKYDQRGPNCHRALADVIRFASGKIADSEGRGLREICAPVTPLTNLVGLVGSSHGGNACILAMAHHGEEFPDLAFYVSMESPLGEGAVNVELGGHATGVNPAYDPASGRLDLSRLAWSPSLTATRPGKPTPASESIPPGALFFDINGDGIWSRDSDFAVTGPTWDAGAGPRLWYTPRLIREADRRNLWGATRPMRIPSVEEAEAFWRDRDAAHVIPDAVRKCPRAAVIVHAGSRDHVQAAPDHPHIIEQVEGFRRAGARFVRLNPDRAYVERVAASLGLGRDLACADAPALIEISRKNIASHLEPPDAPIPLFIQAAIAELADRTAAKEWSPNLDAVLFADAPFGDRAEDSRRQPPRGTSAPAARPAPRGDPAKRTRAILVDASQSAGTIRSLLGTNRGPISYPRESGERPTDHTRYYRAMGIDFIRTHDFYGPTDWWTLFPDWSADPELASSYDFAESDARIRAICENGFGCLYRLGTSWRGRNPRPINDPPGTRRAPDGSIARAAGSEEFKKWARTCAATVRHYTQGWNNGFRFPIEYWEIWNEPDLAEQFWSGTPEQYYLLYEEAAKAIKALNPGLKVGGPACTGSLREAYVERFIQRCRERALPIDFFSWHSYGGRGAFNPHDHLRDARRIRDALDRAGYADTELILSEWNAGIGPALFSDSARGAAYYASTLATLLDAGVSRAFQYCGDSHPGLGLHDRATGYPIRAADAFAAWNRLLATPMRILASGGDTQGCVAVAGKNSEGNRVTLLVSDFQSDRESLHVSFRDLPWAETSAFTCRFFLIDEKRRLEEVRVASSTGRAFSHTLDFGAPGILLAEIRRD